MSLDKRIEAHGKDCPWCGRRMDRMNPRAMPTRDHLFPKSLIVYRPGPHGWTPQAVPIAITCATCNGDKGDFFLGEWLARLERIADPRAARIRQWMADNPELVMWAERLESEWVERQRQKHQFLETPAVVC
jgi:hypothetical protein